MKELEPDWLTTAAQQYGGICKKKKKILNLCSDKATQQTNLCVCFLKVPIILSCILRVQKAAVKSKVCTFFSIFFFFLLHNQVQSRMRADKNSLA